MNVYPSILTGSKLTAQKQVMWISAYPRIRTVQVDIIDGQFIDNVTLTPVDLPEIDFGEVSIDFHFMTEEPLDYVYEALEHSEFYTIRSMIAQVERMSSQPDYINTVKKNEIQVGLSLDLFTPFDAIEDQSWKEIDILQLMAIEAGFQGQELNNTIFEKIKTAVALREQLGRDFEIIIDGGVKPDTIKKLEKAGADSIVIGSGLWDSQDQDELDEAVQTYTQTE
jgi:ribulose-phosphate 3-epimerase